MTAARLDPTVPSLDGSVDVPLDALVVNAELDGAGTNEQVAAAWRAAVRDHPKAYLKVRARLYLAQLGITRPVRATYYARTDEIGWSGADELRQVFPRLNEARLSWLGLSSAGMGTGTLMHAPWLYLALGAAGLAAIGYRDERARSFAIAAGAIIVGGQLVLVVASPVANYRYQLPVVVLGIVFSLSAVGRLRWPRGSGGTVAPPAWPDGDRHRHPGGNDVVVGHTADGPTGSANET